MNTHCHYGNPPSGEVWHYGCPAHFVGGDRCVWHLHSHVNGWCVSSIGEYRTNHGAELEPLGADLDGRGGRLYETMVFPIVGNGHPDRWTCHSMRPAWSREEADRNHADIIEEMRLCDVEKYLKRRAEERAAEADEETDQ